MSDAPKTNPEPTPETGRETSPEKAPKANPEAIPEASPEKQPKASHADKVKFVGLIAFLVVVAVIVALVWPYIHLVFEPDGLDQLIDRVQNAGFGGVLILEAIQFLQVVVAFIPGEVVQVAAGMLYGPWWGALIILVGCIASSAVIYILVHKLGAPFVHDMVPQKYTDKFREFEQSGKFNMVIFVLFLIPGLPKDVFTYITPLSDMKLPTFLVITNLARIPGIVLSTYAADGLLEGRVFESVVMFGVLALIAVVALLVYNRFAAKKK